MIVQYVTALPAFNPHGGPITHSSTGSKPDSPVPPCTQGCSSRVASYVIHEPPSIWYQTNTYSRGFEPLSRHISDIERLPARSKLPRIPPYSALDIFLSFNSRVTFRHLPRCYQPDSQPFRGLLFRSYPLSFVSTMEFSKKGRRLHRDDPKQRNEDINIMDRPLREEQPRPAHFFHGSGNWINEATVQLLLSCSFHFINTMVQQIM